MQIHFLSDVHADVWPFAPSQEPEVVILAGDIHSDARAVQWALDTFKNPLTTLLLVMGNHDYYGTRFETGLVKMREEAARSKGRVHVLDRDVVVLGHVRFLGATAWTDYKLRGDDPFAMFDAQQLMNDHRKIRFGAGYRKWLPSDAQKEAFKTRAWLKQILAQPFSGKTVLITHHPIIPMSVSDRKEYRKNPSLDAAYASNWLDLFEPGNIDAYIYGHTHAPADYWLGNTRVLSNPRGYPMEDCGFNPNLLIEL